MRRKFTCYRCGKYVETEMDDNGDATCPACENAIDLEPERKLQKRIASLESENAELRERTRWIPVSERLPEDEEEVLLFSMSSGYFIATFHDASSGRGIDTFETDGDDMAPVFHPDSSVLHWMPLPDAPEEDE